MRIAMTTALFSVVMACQSTVAAAGDAPMIALKPGLVVLSAISEGGVDYEGVRTITRADGDGITIAFRWKAPGTSVRSDVNERAATRVVRREDLADANRMAWNFGESEPDLFPGSTAIQTSAKVLASLKQGQDTPFIFGVVIGSLGGVFSAMTPRKYYRGTLQRVEAKVVPFSILLNGKRTTVSAVHARGTMALGSDRGEAEFWWLDQPDNALTLRWKFKGDVVQVVRIDTPSPAAEAAAVAPGLASPACRAELHGIYFDSASANLLRESDAMIERVAALLKAEPAWQVTIEGHTDNVGTASDNLELSQKRAEAVRAALAAQAGAKADRLSAVGFGETRPVESNETMEGRARNRRVELSRKCK